MLILSGVSSDNKVYSSVVKADVPTARRAMLKGFKYATGWKTMQLILDGKPIAYLYRDLSGAPVWR